MRQPFDVIIFGASIAGLSAALTLSRARRSVLVLDAGHPRNSVAESSHGFFTRDGASPSELLRLGREQLAPYGVEIRSVAGSAITGLPGSDGGFQVELADGTLETARRLILATGVRDLLPELPGVEERWGRSVHHCPYCHGWEVQHESVTVYQQGPLTFFRAVTIHQWAPELRLLTDGPASLTAEQRQQLEQLGIGIDERPLARLEGPGTTLERVVFRDGSSLGTSALFIGPGQEQRSSLAAQLGCGLTDDGIYVKTDAQGQTTVPGVYAAGDMTAPMQQVALAAASGVVAAAGLNHALIFADLPRVAPNLIGR